MLSGTTTAAHLEEQGQEAESNRPAASGKVSLRAVLAEELGDPGMLNLST
eukprot:COSAG01_NODE_61109_length_291_cov_0.750000_1_plen_49_part_10